MAMAKMISRLIKRKHSISVQNQPTKSISSSSILFKRLVPTESKKENILSILKYPISDTDIIENNFVLPACFRNPEDVSILGHSHGIFCIADQSGDISLFNPSTTEFRKLPPSILLMNRLPLTSYDSIMTSTSAVGFGYDPKSNDFKVVRIVDFSKTYDWDVVVEVYDLSTDRWRGYNKTEPFHAAAAADAMWNPSFEICHKCIYYWWDYYDNILSFDMAKEVFCSISMPKGFVSNREWFDNDRSLLVWNGYIVLFDYPSRGDEKSFDIWLMVMDGSVEWVKLMTIGPLSGIERPLLFVNSDQELIMEAKDGQVVSYSLITKELKDLPIKGEPLKNQCFHFEHTSLSVSKGCKTVASDVASCGLLRVEAAARID